LLCSSCQHTIRPVVAVDIDGTLGDYHSHFLRFATDWLGGQDLGPLLEASINMYDGTYPFRDYCGDILKIDTATYRTIKLAYRQGGMKRSMPIFQRAGECITRIFMAGAEVWLTTTRPYLSLDNIIPDTVEWCRRHNIDYEGMLFDEDKYAQLAERVDPDRVVAVIDDLEEMCTAANELFDGAAILASNQFNIGVSFSPKLDIGRAGFVAATRAKEWSITHE
jgi:phosphoglycolate phosphatase-like HAD superfamily hydrolase